MADVKTLAAVGNAAQGKKGPSQGPMKLKSISVDFSDNGGATIREIRERQVPEGRRAGAGFPMNSDVKENTFEDLARARTHIMSLMGGGSTMPEAPPRPPAAALAGGPRGVAGAVRGPAGNVGVGARPVPMAPPGGGGGGPF